MPYCLLSVFSDTVVPNNLSKSLLGHKRLLLKNPSKTDLGRNDLSKSLLGRNGCSYIRMIFLNLSWVLKGCILKKRLFLNNPSKTDLGRNGCSYI